MSRRRKRRHANEIVDINQMIRDDADANVPTPEPEIVEVIPAVGSVSRRWLVSLLYAPTLEVEAADEASAWEEYKRQTSILASDHIPLVREIRNHGD